MLNKTLFAKLVRYTCWISDLLLIGLAIFLSATNRDALTPLLMLTISLCILGGCFFPLLVYYIDFLFAQNEVRAEAQHAPESLRQSVNRLSELTQRVEVAIADVTKATLIARQVPDRIEEKTAFLEDVSNRMQPGMLDSMLATLSSMETRLYSLHADWEGLQRKLDRAESETSLEMASETILRRLTEIEKQFNQRLSEDRWSSFADWSESLGAELASIRELIKSLDANAGTMAPPKTSPSEDTVVAFSLEPSEEAAEIVSEDGAGEGPDEEDESDEEGERFSTPPEEITSVETVIEPDAADEIESEEEPEDEPESDWVDETALSESEKELAVSFLEAEEADATVSEPVDLSEAEDAVVSEREKSDGEAALEEEPEDSSGITDEAELSAIESEMDELSEAEDLFAEEEQVTEEKAPKGAQRVEQAMFFDDMEEPSSVPLVDSETIIIQAKVLVGIANRVFIRGEGGDLSWDEGTPLELTGIGEWRWMTEGVHAPIRCQLWLNDDRPAEGDVIELSPGEVHVLTPVF